jgi:hypothetical protein
MIKWAISNRQRAQTPEGTAADQAEEAVQGAMPQSVPLRQWKISTKPQQAARPLRKIGLETSSVGAANPAKGEVSKMRKAAQRDIQTADHISPRATLPTQKIRADAPTPQARQITAAKVRAARKAVKQSTVAVGKALVQAGKAAVKSFIPLIAGAGVLTVVLVSVLLGAMLCSPLGLFFSGEADNELTTQQVLSELNTAFSERITEIENTVAHDDVQQSGSQASQKDILAVYAVKITTDPDNPLDAVTMDEQRAEILREIFWTMNQIDYATETYTEEETVQVPNEASDAEEGDMVEEIQTVERTRLLITITGKTAEEMATESGFTQERLGYLTELLSDDYAELWYGLPSGTSAGSGDLVAVALSQLGNAGGQAYWSWYGFSSRVAWCAIFVSWCADQCGYLDAGVIPKFSYCDYGIAWFQSRGQWQGRSYIPAPGDIIFFDWDGNGNSDHVGIVESCDGTTVCTVEGNSSNAVRQRQYAVGSAKIMGYGVPAYAS